MQHNSRRKHQNLTNSGLAEATNQDKHLPPPPSPVHANASAKKKKLTLRSALHTLTGSCTYSAQIIATRTSTGIAANHRVPSTTRRPMKPLLTEFCSASKVLTAPTKNTPSSASLTRTRKYAGAESSECDFAWWSSLSLKRIKRRRKGQSV